MVLLRASKILITFETETLGMGDVGDKAVMQKAICASALKTGRYKLARP